MGIPDNLLPHTVNRVRAASTTDAYGNTVLDYGAGADRKVVQAWLQQDTRREQLAAGRDPLEERWLLLANEPDITGLDRIEWTGPAGPVAFTVEGPPAPVYTAAGYHHTEASLKVVTG